MDNLLIQEEVLQVSDLPENCKYSRILTFDSGVYETIFTTRMQVYKYGLKTYGRCISKVYVDIDSKSKSIGYVFQKMVKYEDCNKTYLQETWITIHKSLPVKSITYNYA